MSIIYTYITMQLSPTDNRIYQSFVELIKVDNDWCYIVWQLNATQWMVAIASLIVDLHNFDIFKWYPLLIAIQKVGIMIVILMGNNNLTELHICFEIYILKLKGQTFECQQHELFLKCHSHSKGRGVMFKIFGFQNNIFWFSWPILVKKITLTSCRDTHYTPIPLCRRRILMKIDVRIILITGILRIRCYNCIT